MLDKLNKAISEYRLKWDKISDLDSLKNQKPTAAAWKVTDQAELIKYFEELRDLCDQIHWGWVNERWLVTLHLKDQKLEWGISVIKLMQRRPDSEDAVGLDHIDFYSADNKNVKEKLAKTDLKWTPESNENNCSWISVWFDGTEAKLRSDTVLQPCINELEETQQKVINA